MLTNIESKLLEHLKLIIPAHQFNEVLNYALFPVGKLFRPKLVYALAMDAKAFRACHEFFASSLEIHHAYTLIHDDLPAMDDDDYRRGKLTVHKKFNEAQAILAGDALLNFSYELLSHISSIKISKLLSLYGKFTGAQGLILGQVLDLEKKEKNLDDTILIHQLKTSRLIQLALVGSNYLADDVFDEKQLIQLGDSLGLVFQLLDDLGELATEINVHEATINPFLKFEQKLLFNLLAKNIKNIEEIVKNQKLLNLNNVIKDYLSQTQNKIILNQKTIANHYALVDSIIDLIK